VNSYPLQFDSNPPLGLYIHLPWCAQKCPYCDFNSHQSSDFDESAYVNALIEDLLLDLPLIWGRSISSIFIGGGTPSLFSAGAMQQLLSELRACLNFNPGIEITIEANPGSADESHFEGYLNAGINRLSIGVQSFDNASLKALGRIHDSKQALSAFDKARKAGFQNINLDLMFALPGQTLQLAEADLQQAIALQPEHISHYQLTIEPNTLFYQQLPKQIPGDDLSWEMQQNCQTLLAQQGYQQYEISAYARPDRQSHHNMNYWQFGDYMGIGAGAHGKITLPAENRVIRRQRQRQPQKYLKSIGDERISHQQALSAQDLIFEFMLNALRLTEGFDLSLFDRHSGMGQEVLQSPLRKAQELDLINIQQNHLTPSELGLRFHNDLQALFLDVNIPGKKDVHLGYFSQ
jgi:putative oxygen-independent coproporphyrinogen III oxidase